MKDSEQLRLTTSLVCSARQINWEMHYHI